MIIKLTRTLIIFGTVLLLSGGLTVYAATTLFTQNIPGQTVLTPLLTEGTSCSGGNLYLDPNTSTNPLIAGKSALLGFTCTTTGGAGSEAFDTAGGTVSVTPTFTVPTGWSLGVSSLEACTTPTGLTSGTPVTLTSSSPYWYCLTSTSASTFTSFAITWAQ